MSKEKPTILEREEIILSDSQNKMIISGWGQEVLDKTVTVKITYLSDGLKVTGYISYPNDKSKKYPCIIWNRGGIGNKGAIDSFTARGIFGQLASWDTLSLQLNTVVTMEVKGRMSLAVMM